MNLKSFNVFCLFLVFALALCVNTEARDLFGESDNSPRPLIGKLSQDPFVTIGYHRVNRMGFSITNKGQLGLFGEDVENPQYPGEQARSLEYPIETGVNNLWGGALWIGGIVGEDTLVSVAADGWFATQEMWPPDLPQGAIIYRSIDSGDVDAVSNQDFIAVYTDTLTDPVYVQNDPIDSRPHQPLGIEITQMSYAWDYPYAEDFVLMDFSLKNIGVNDLEDVYIGFYVDADVGSEDAPAPYSDDVAGFKENHTWNAGDCQIEYELDLAYIIDNNGLDGNDSCPYDDTTPNDITGIKILRAPMSDWDINFNWWYSNGNAALDFGPRLAGTAEDPFRDFGGHLGTPTGDRNKYYMLSHPEKDYDQLYTAVDHTAEGWLAPPSGASELAGGTDTKYLISFGPLDLSPGMVLPFTMALVAGEELHSGCGTFESLFDPSNPDPYYSTFDFSDIGMNAVYASWVYDNPGVDTDGDGYFGEFEVCCVDSELVGDVWECTEFDTIYYSGDGIPDFRGFVDTVYVNIDQPQLHWADANLVEPEKLTITLGDMALMFNPGLVDESSVQVNGLTPEIVTVDSDGSMEVLEIEVDKSGFVGGYGFVWDNEEHQYIVTGMQTNGHPLEFTGTVNIQGHISGDVNVDGQQNLLDIMYLVDYKFRDGPAPQPVAETGDVDGSGVINVMDILYYLDFYFNDGPDLMHP